MAEDLQCEAKGGERPTSGVRRRHGGQDAQCYLARRLLCGDCKWVAIGAVLHHRATRDQLSSDPQILIRNPHATHLLQEKGLAWGSAEEVHGLQTCVQKMIDKKIKLVNMVQVMLFRRILPC